jgi:hypothetical protein
MQKSAFQNFPYTRAEIVYHDIVLLSLHLTNIRQASLVLVPSPEWQLTADAITSNPRVSCLSMEKKGPS